MTVGIVHCGLCIDYYSSCFDEIFSGSFESDMSSQYSFSMFTFCLLTTHMIPLLCSTKQCFSVMDLI